LATACWTVSTGARSARPANLLERDFHAATPGERLVTDITEFRIPAGKVYLSPIIDCFDGMPVAWAIGEHPDAALVNGMLDEAVGAVGTGRGTIVHSDRGCHYRWPGWIGRMDGAGWTRSMSGKGCSPDNAAAEGFFGNLKMEFFHGRDWENVTTAEFIERLDAHMRWHRDERIKHHLGGRSPREYRESLKQAP
jgi:transposase InsO family protein